MEIVLAKLGDLNEIKEVYTKIIDNMYINDIKIWNEYYPNEVFELDIKNNNMFLLKDNNEIIGAFVLYEHIDVEDDIMWEDRNAKAYLLNRVGVNVKYLNNGIGQRIIANACEIAKSKGAKYLRLLVSDKNRPAINLYEKCDLKRKNGIHVEKIRDDYSIHEYGYELLLIQSDTMIKID